MSDGSTCKYKCLNGTCVNTREDCVVPTMTTPNIDFTTVDIPGADSPGNTGSKVGKI